MATTQARLSRIGIDGGDFMPSHPVQSGIDRLLSGFLSGLRPDSMKKKKLYLYRFGPSIKLKLPFPATIRTLPSALFSSLMLPLRMLFDRVGVFIGFSGIIPPFIRLFKVRSIVCIHDFAFLDHPENYGKPERMKWQTEYAIYGAHRIIVFSDYIRTQTLKRYPGIPADKVLRIYPGADHIDTRLKHEDGKKNRYFLYVGVIKPAKNILALLSRFEKFVRLHNVPDVKLVLVGPREGAYYESITKTLVYHKLQGRLEFKTDVSDDELAALYRGCIALLNVSHEEGFCYPVVEALSLSVPVILNSIPLYHEFEHYFTGMYIAHDEDRFIAAMIKGYDRKLSISQLGPSPFRWGSFTRRLIEVTDKLP